MKRLSIRISVVVAVVSIVAVAAFGLSQVGAKGPAPREDSTADDQAASPRTFPEPSTGTPPRTLPVNTQSNPLRAISSRTYSGGNSLAAPAVKSPGVIRASGELTSAPSKQGSSDLFNLDNATPAKSSKSAASNSPARLTSIPSAGNLMPAIPQPKTASLPSYPKQEETPAPAIAAPANPAPLNATASIPNALPSIAEPPNQDTTAVEAPSEPATMPVPTPAAVAAPTKLPRSLPEANRSRPAPSNSLSSLPSIPTAKSSRTSTSRSLPSSDNASDSGEPGRLVPTRSLPLAGGGTGTPGTKNLEGPQSPQVTVEKHAPVEIQVGKPATFTTKVRNSGKFAACNVEIHDDIPKGTRLLTTQPQASQGVHSEMVWSLGNMAPGEEAVVEMQVMPMDEGQLGSVATVSFQAEASACSVSTKPELVVETSAPARVLVGESLELTVVVSNPGSGIATGVVLEEHIPQGLQHPAGSELEYEVGQLKPNESKQIKLQMTAEQAGMISNVLVARGDASLKTEHRLDIEVVAPQFPGA
jgi:uncharacterized repeat protein (TIGR01451 family)